MHRLTASLALLLMVACGGRQTTTAAPLAAPVATRHRRGDYVVYRYTGEHIGRGSRVLMEEVVDQDGDRLVIEVTLSQRRETLRRWRQTVIDTEANRAANRVEALCEYQGEECVPLANEGNADLTRLYEGLTLTPDAPPTDATTADEERTLGGVTMTCHVRTAHPMLAGARITTTDVECPDFVWTHAGATFIAADKTELLRVAVEAAGSSISR